MGRLNFLLRPKQSATHPIKLPNSIHSIDDLITYCSRDADFTTYSNEGVVISFFKSLVDIDKIHKVVIPSLKNEDETFPLRKEFMDSAEMAMSKLLSGYCLLRQPKNKRFLLVDVNEVVSRAIVSPEAEATVIGPKLAFNENIMQNINMIRSNVRTSALRVEEKSKGNVAERKVFIVYLGLAEQ